MKHGHVIPLVGGQTIATMEVSQELPTVLLSYKPFTANDSNLRAYLPEVPYHFLEDEPDLTPYRNLDFMTATCPCAGLSLASNGTPERRASMNSWLLKSTDLILGDLKPRVFMGESAPTFFTGRGESIRDYFENAAKQNGYAFSCYYTNTVKHGLPQSRKRTFYFFWKDNSAPLLSSYDLTSPSLETYLTQATNTPDEETSAVNDFNEDLHVRFLKYTGGFQQVRDWLTANKKRNITLNNYLRTTGQFNEFVNFVQTQGSEREAGVVLRQQTKLDTGGSIFDFSKSLTTGYFKTLYWRTHYAVHPIHDRVLTERERMHLMGLPADYKLITGVQAHISQNVPVTTAACMVREVQKYFDGQLKMSGERVLLQNNLI